MSPPQGNSANPPKTSTAPTNAADPTSTVTASPKT